MLTASDPRAAFLSAAVPGLGQLVQGRLPAATAAFAVAVSLLAASAWAGRVTDRAVEVLLFMVLALPWWVIQSYDAYLGDSPGEPALLRTWRRIWRQGHDIRFLGVLLLISAVNDTWIILNNLSYLLPFYCTKLDGIPGIATKAVSPVLHTLVGYGFVRLRRWALLVYLVYAAYGVTNGLVNLTCFGPGRIRNALLTAIIVSTLYILWRRPVLLARPS